MGPSPCHLPPPEGEGGCSPWRTAVDMGTAQHQTTKLTPFPGMWRFKLGSKNQWPLENNCLHRLTTYKHLITLCHGTQPPAPPLTFSASFFIIPATSSGHELQPQVPTTDPL